MFDSWYGITGEVETEEVGLVKSFVTSSATLKEDHRVLISSCSVPSTSLYDHKANSFVLAYISQRLKVMRSFNHRLNCP